MASSSDIIKRVIRDTPNLPKYMQDLVTLAAAESLAKGGNPENFSQWLGTLISMERRGEYHRGRGMAATAIQDQEESFLTKEDRERVLKGIVRGLPPSVRIALMSVLRDPGEFKCIMASNMCPKHKITLSYALQSYYKRTGQGGRRPLRIPLEAMNKQKAVAALFATRPDLYVILLSCGSMEGFIEVVSLLRGRTVTFPSPAELSGIIDAYDGKPMAVKLSSRQQAVYRDSLDAFFLSSIKSLLRMEKVTERAVVKRAASLDSAALLRLYRILGNSISHITRESME